MRIHKSQQKFLFSLSYYIFIGKTVEQMTTLWVRAKYAAVITIYIE